MRLSRKGAARPRWTLRGWVRCILICLTGAAVVLPLGGLAYQAHASADDAARYPPPGQLVDVGGYRLHIRCLGSGSPAVLLEAGLGSGALTWAGVHPTLAQTTRVCAYDRAGLGWSEPGPPPRSGAQLVADLHALLTNAGIPGPYVLVGHSAGGLYIRLYAHQFPQDVAGMVLVDARPEDFDADEPAALRQAEIAPLANYHLWTMLEPFGVLRLAGDTGLAPALANLGQGYPPDQQPVARALFYRTGHAAAVYAEYQALDATVAAVRATGPLGDIPLVVLTATAGHYASDAPGADEAEQLWQRLQARLVQLSPRGTQILAPQSHHAIQAEQPDLVIAAVQQVVAAARR